MRIHWIHHMSLSTSSLRTREATETSVGHEQATVDLVGPEVRVTRISVSNLAVLFAGLGYWGHCNRHLRATLFFILKSRMSNLRHRTENALALVGAFTERFNGSLTILEREIQSPYPVRSRCLSV